MNGPFTICVRGNGQSATGNANDADAIAKSLVDTLKAAGHTLTEARFCQQACTDLLTGTPVTPVPVPVTAQR